MEIINPKISIIVPVYLSEPFLHQCIDSLKNQTLQEIEIILVNDGSPDRSGEICDQYSHRDSRVYTIHQENQSASIATENGLAIAKGEYVMLVDADDWLEPETCEIAYKTAKEHNADAVFWPFIKEFPNRSINENSILQKDIVFENENLNWLKRRMMGLVGEELKSPTRTDAINSRWGKIFRHKMITEKKISAINKDGKGSYDVLYVNKAFVHVKKAVYVHQFLYHYRKSNPSSVTKNYGLTMWGGLKRMLLLLEEIITENDLGEEYRIALKNRISLSIINNVLSLTSQNNSLSINKKAGHLKSIINDPLYQQAISEFKLKYLPWHWKVFFVFVKIPFPLGVYLMGLAMQKLRDK